MSIVSTTELRAAIADLQINENYSEIECLLDNWERNNENEIVEDDYAPITFNEK